jgi:hypothetical protein
MSADLPSSREVVEFHDRCLAQPGWAKESSPRHTEGVWAFIEANHRCNCLLWDEEDQARRRDVPDAAIAANKRAIDGHNQKRNDAIEKIDEALLAGLAAAKRDAGARPDTETAGVRLNSETAGAMIDRLSILSLKIHHMRAQTARADASPEHVETSRGRLARFVEQRADLAACLDALLADCLAGRARFKVYRQFKMYNDPDFNPYLYGAKRP